MTSCTLPGIDPLSNIVARCVSGTFALISVVITAVDGGDPHPFDSTTEHRMRLKVPSSVTALIEDEDDRLPEAADITVAQLGALKRYTVPNEFTDAAEGVEVFVVNLSSFYGANPQYTGAIRVGLEFGFDLFESSEGEPDKVPYTAQVEVNVYEGAVVSELSDYDIEDRVSFVEDLDPSEDDREAEILAALKLSEEPTETNTLTVSRAPEKPTLEFDDGFYYENSIDWQWAFLSEESSPELIDLFE